MLYSNSRLKQLGPFRRLSAGTWTVCLRIDRWIPAEMRRFRTGIARLRSQIATLHAVRQRYRARRRDGLDSMFFTCSRVARSIQG
jgi:hypothetical protein